VGFEIGKIGQHPRIPNHSITQDPQIAVNNGDKH